MPRKFYIERGGVIDSTDEATPVAREGIDVMWTKTANRLDIGG